MLDEYLFNFDNLPSDFYDLKKLAKIMIETDGAETQLAKKDNEEHTVEIDGKT